MSYFVGFTCLIPIEHTSTQIGHFTGKHLGNSPICLVYQVERCHSDILDSNSQNYPTIPQSEFW